LKKIKLLAVTFAAALGVVALTACSSGETKKEEAKIIKQMKNNC